MADRNDKRALRAEFLEKRKQAAAAAGPETSQAMTRHFLDHFPPDPVLIVAGYVPMRGEADPLPLLAALQEEDVITALPRIEARAAALGFFRWIKGEALVEGTFGTSEPAREAEAVTPDIVLVPLIAFDKDGARLGYGGGFYDRTLEALRMRHKVLAVGFAFAAQEAENLPSEAHDAALDAVVTEKGVRFFS